ncbi:MAG: hypothetical protein P8080_10855 [Gammaproteobacteria bacterium]
MTDKALPSAAVEALAEAVGREHVLLDPADRWSGPWWPRAVSSACP